MSKLILKAIPANATSAGSDQTLGNTQFPNFSAAILARVEFWVSNFREYNNSYGNQL